MGQQESRVGNYDLGRIVLEQSDTFPWSICPGIDKDETEVTLFLHKTKSNTSANEDQLFWLENGVKVNTDKTNSKIFYLSVLWQAFEGHSSSSRREVS